MKSNYFNKLVTPLVKASAQHAQFTEGDVVFDWASFDIPRGVARILGATITYRKNKVANQVGCLDLVFAKDDGTNSTPTSLGVGNALLGATNFATVASDIVGFLPGKLTDMPGEGILATAASCQTMHSSPSPIVLEPNSNSGANIGVDRYYVAGLASGALDMRGLVAVTDGLIDVSGEDGTITTIDGTSPELVFAAGDILHLSDDIILGEVGAVADTPSITFKFSGETSANHSGTYTVPADIAAWRIQNGAGGAGDGAEDEIIYNVFPLRITLHLSK